jgi:uncharacterized protein YjbI with pentapeptide repeats
MTEEINHQRPEEEATAPKWGDPIGEERQRELQALLDGWNGPGADHGERKGPFDGGPGHDGMLLTGADVFWLAERSERSKYDEYLRNLHLEGAGLTGAHLERAELRGVHLEGARLWGAHLERANLIEAHLEQAVLVNAHLERADLWGAHLEGANLGSAHFEGARLNDVQFEGARLGAVHFDQASLYGAHLKGVDMEKAYLRGADFREAHLEGASLRGTTLQGANLSQAWMDSATDLTDAYIDKATSWADVHWAGVGVVDLTHLPWHRVRTLGFWRESGTSRYVDVLAVWDYVRTLGVLLKSEPRDHVHPGETRVRTYRQLAVQLRAQGMSEVADRFLYRAQVVQRGVLLQRALADWPRPWRIPGDLVRWLFSWFLELFAGYGYHPGRIVFWYLVTIFGFMWGYLQVTHGAPLFGLHEPAGTQPLQWYEALILSVASFHGRGFFPQGSSLGDPVTMLAALEAVLGLLLEITLIATFTQRFFGPK